MSRNTNKALIVPETFQGGEGWDDWITRFENVATVNGWDAESKLNWLKVCLTGRAQKAFQSLPEASRADYAGAKEALTERFEPASKRELYNAELQVRTKRKNEGWADFAEELRCLTEKAFPEMDAKSVEQMALTHYLSRLTNPQVAFAVKQQRPKKLEEAVRATLEVESYLPKPAVVGSVNPDDDESMCNESTVGAISSSSGRTTGHMTQSSEQTLMRAVDQLTQRLSQLEAATQQRFSRQQGNIRRPPNQPLPRDQAATVICYRCGKEGHYARGCALRHPSRQEN